MKRNFLSNLKEKKKVVKLSMTVLVGAVSMCAGAALYSASAMITGNSISDPTDEMPLTSSETDQESTENRLDLVVQKDSKVDTDEQTIDKVEEADCKSVEEQMQQGIESRELYELKALNVEDAEVLLRTGVIENFRIGCNLSSVNLNGNGDRLYIADQGDDFVKLLVMLYPSVDGRLNANTTYKGIDNFAKYGGAKPEFLAKVCAVLNNYREEQTKNPENRNKEMEIPKKFESMFVEDKLTNIRVLDSNFISAMHWMKKFEFADEYKSLSTPIDELGEIKALGERIKNFGQSKEEIEELKNLVQRKQQPKKRFITEDEEKFNKFIEDFPKLFPDKADDYKKCISDKQKFKFFQTLLQERFEMIKAYDEKINRIKKDYAKIGFEFSFISALKGAVDLENAKDSPYPQYLVEKILMSYMLYNKSDIDKFYAELDRLLKINESDISNEDIEKEKARISRLKMILESVIVQKLSPYKEVPRQNALASKISRLGNGNVKFLMNSFADCADIALRHVINLLVYSNADCSRKDEEKWGVLLDAVDIKDLNEKLERVKKAIEKKDTVEFYDFKTRLQIFFLYQRDHGADDDTFLARTLWEYAICNMGSKEQMNESDQDKSFYNITYNKVNVELYPGYKNMLKIMWNIACALNLGSEKTETGETKLNISKNKIELLCSRGYDKKIFEDALRSTFALFHPNKDMSFDEITCDPMSDKNEIIGKVKVKVTKDEEILEFVLSHDLQGISGHAEVKHEPTKFRWNEEFENPIYLEDEFSRLALKRFRKKQWEDLMSMGFYDDLKSFGKLCDDLITIGFYGNFSEAISRQDCLDSLAEKDKAIETQFRKTELYKKREALRAFKKLQGEESNVYVINSLINEDIMSGAELISIDKDKKLSDIIYEKYLKPLEHNMDLNENILSILYKYELEKSGKEVKGRLGLKYLKTDVEDEVKILVDKCFDEVLHIPSVIEDENGNKLKVVSILKINPLGNLKKVIFKGDFNKLNISRNMFANLTSLINVQFTGRIDNLTIEDRAFKDCKNLERVEILSSVGSNVIKNLVIGKYTFSNCSNLTDFKISAVVENFTVGNDAFSACVSLPQFKISNGSNAMKNLVIGRYAFSDCGVLEVFEISAAVENLFIKERAFENCSAIKVCKILSNSNVMKNLVIGESAFLNCGELIDFEILAAVDNLSIEKSAFCRCAKLTNFVIASAVENLIIGQEAFEDCTSLKNFKMLDNITNLTIAYYAFKTCEVLSSFDISHSVRILSIGEDAFSDHIGLKIKLHSLERLRVSNRTGINLELTKVSHLMIAQAFCKDGIDFNIPEHFDRILISKDLKDVLMELLSEDSRKKVLYYQPGSSYFNEPFSLETSDESESVKFTHEELDDIMQFYSVDVIKAFDSKGKSIPIELDDDLKTRFQETRTETEKGTVIVYKKAE